MFNFIIATNSVTKEISNTIEILSTTKSSEDKIILINYHRNHILYREEKYGVDYRHIKDSRTNAINSVLPECADTVVFAASGYVTKTFMRDIRKFFDCQSLQTLRRDKISKSGKFVESDYRIGSTIAPSSFIDSSIAFNTSVITSIDNNLLDTAKRAADKNISLKLLVNVKTLVVADVTTNKANIGITVIIPSRTHKLSSHIKNSLMSNDRVVEFSESPRTISSIISKAALKSENDCILLVSPHSSIYDKSITSKIRNLYRDNKTILFGSVSTDISSNCWLATSKQSLSDLPRSLTTTTAIMKYIVDNCKTLMRYDDRMKVREPKNSSTISPITTIPDMISIIIPFMYNGDRWPLFDATIDRLYHCTKGCDNIEIIIHETAPKRHIKTGYVDKYDLVYLYTKYDKIFHRAWNLNVVARYVARGSTLVFFDADLIVDDAWVNELLSCDKTKPHIGWGEMKNLNKQGTDQYIKTKVLSENLERTRTPKAISAAGGVNVIPRDLFFGIGGWPESYKDLGYGGEDNSFIYKMISLGMKNKAFKSSIYHLFHGHQTKRVKDTSTVFRRHKDYNKENWLEHIKRWYDWGEPVDNINVSLFQPYINETLLYVYKSSIKPRITLCMVTYLRYDILIKSLKTLLDLDIPINLILWINEAGSMPPATKKVVDGLLDHFSCHDVIYSKKNMGTGYPRYMMLTKAYHEYDTDYIMTTNDDIMFLNSESLVMGSTILDQKGYSGYGAIGLWCTPDHPIMIKSGDTLKKKDPKEGFYDVSCLGAATMTIRREVLETCNCDPLYTIGFVDWDFSMTMTSKGYKLGLLCDDRFRPTNDVGGRDKKYKEGRSDKKTIDNSKQRFMDKWNIKI